MSAFFLKIVNMSISASWLVLAVLLLRLALKKAPKWVSVLLWGFVAVRLLCPVTVESIFSLIPSSETVRPGIMLDWTPEVSTGISSLDTVINPLITETFAPEPIASANPLQILIPLASIVWLAGIAGMLLYTAVSYILLRRKVATAVRLRDNLYQSENVYSPFVLGIIKPRIYLPFRMDGQGLEHVIAHEQTHIRRKDHWWKPLGFLLLAVYWFNPLMWLGYILLCRDIELACDEKVIKEMDNENRADYTQALVACSVRRRSIAACPLAFGEVGVKARVKSVLNYKKPAFWIIIAAIITCAVVAVCFLTDPVGDRGTAINYDVTPPTVLYPWVQEYTPGTDGIQGNVDTEKYLKRSENFAIGANRLGMAVFKEPHKAFLTLTALYPEAIAAIQREFDLPPLSETDYKFYGIYGWQITTGSKKLKEQATFVTQFFDTYENSFIGDAPEGAVEIVNTVTTNLKTYYQLSDGTWRVDGRNYKYRLEITGRMHDAAVDSTFVYLSNRETITFDQAWKAAGLSSNTEDYFPVEEAVLVERGTNGFADGTISDGRTFLIATDNLEKAITIAILEQNTTDRFPEGPSDLIHAEAHQVLGIQSSPVLEGEREYITELTVYVQYVYHRYRPQAEALSSVASIATPAVFKFRGGPARGYELQEFKEPKGGNIYAEEISNLFPQDIAAILLNPQNEVIDMEELEDMCLKKAQGNLTVGKGSISATAGQ
ncbi:MAG: M56 family metallopeptidase [Oscillospiraceae bacterium]|nr:M56 family metallopeptidase [Oscillospiraceae bacterium]